MTVRSDRWTRSPHNVQCRRLVHRHAPDGAPALHTHRSICRVNDIDRRNRFVERGRRRTFGANGSRKVGSLTGECGLLVVADTEWRVLRRAVEPPTRTFPSNMEITLTATNRYKPRAGAVFAPRQIDPCENAADTQTLEAGRIFHSGIHALFE